MPDNIDRIVPIEASALMTTLQQTPPSARTACSAWQAHDIAAHLAAGAKEHADLIEHRLSGHGERATRDFEEREAPFRALDQDTLMSRLGEEIARKARAYAALLQAGDPSIGFTGTRITKEKSETHSRSEAALHRWDITGDDDTSPALLAQPLLVEHAVWVLNNMPILNESAHGLGARATALTSAAVTVVLRAAEEPDVVVHLDGDASRLQIQPEASAADLVVTMAAHHRPLMLWGRRPAALAPTIEGNRELMGLFERVIWPTATRWP